METTKSNHCATDKAAELSASATRTLATINGEPALESLSLSAERVQILPRLRLEQIVLLPC